MKKQNEEFIKKVKSKEGQLKNTRKKKDERKVNDNEDK